MHPVPMLQVPARPRSFGTSSERGSTPPPSGMFARSASLGMGHRSIIPLDPFNSITSEDADRLRNTLAEHERRASRTQASAWQASSTPLSKSRVLAILRDKGTKHGVMVQALVFLLSFGVYIGIIFMQQDTHDGREMKSALEMTLHAKGQHVGTFSEIATQADVWAWMEEVPPAHLFLSLALAVL